MCHRCAQICLIYAQFGHRKFSIDINSVTFVFVFIGAVKTSSTPHSQHHHSVSVLDTKFSDFKIWSQNMSDGKRVRQQQTAFALLKVLCILRSLLCVTVPINGIFQRYDDTFDNSAHLITLKVQLNWITQRHIEYYGYVLWLTGRCTAHTNAF